MYIFITSFFKMVLFSRVVFSGIVLLILCHSLMSMLDNTCQVVASISNAVMCLSHPMDALVRGSCLILPAEGAKKPINSPSLEKRTKYLPIALPSASLCWWNLAAEGAEVGGAFPGL